MKPQLAIEISEKYLKMAALKPSPGPQKEKDALEIIVEPITHFTDKQITEAISAALTKAKLRPKTAVLSIPRNMATVKNLRLPSQNAKEVEQMIGLHIGRLVPYKKEEILFAHEFLGVDTTGYSDELLAIVRRDNVRRFYDIVEAAGISVDRIALGSHGSWHWALDNFKAAISKKDLYLLLDVDWAFTDLIIFSSDYLIFSRSIVAEIGEEGFKQAEIAKLINEVKQSLIIFYNEALNKKPMAIYLSGAQAVSELKDRMESEFDIPVKYVPAPYSNPPGLPAPGLPKNVSMSAVSELVTAGKGEDISFTLPEMQLRTAFRQKAREMVALGTMCIYLCAAIFAVFLGSIYLRQGYLKKLNYQNSLIRDSVGAIMDKAKKVEIAKEVVRSRKAPFAILHSLQALTPQKIALTYINIEPDGKIILRGQGAQLSDVFEFIGALEKSDSFKGAAAKYTRTKKVKDKEVTDFEIEVTSNL